jgi:hypothetical protein
MVSTYSVFTGCGPAVIGQIDVHGLALQLVLPQARELSRFLAEQLAIHFKLRGRVSLFVPLEVDAQREILATQPADLWSEALARRVVGLVDELDHVLRVQAALAAGEWCAQG